jgi:CYTH domain-containing protein
LDTYHSQAAGLRLLQAEVHHPDESVRLPPFLEVGEEVTNDPRYTTTTIAAGRWD